MKRLLEILLFGVLLAAIVFLSAGAAWFISLRHATKQAERDELQLAPQLSTALGRIQGIEQNTIWTEAEMAGLLNSQRHAVADEKPILDATKTTIGNLGTAAKSLNELIVAAKKPVESLNGTVTSLNGAIDSIQKQSSAMLDEGTETLKSAKADLDNPDLAKALADLSAAGAELKDALTQLLAIATDGRQVADHERDVILAPVKKAMIAYHLALDAIHRILF